MMTVAPSDDSTLSPLERFYAKFPRNEAAQAQLAIDFAGADAANAQLIRDGAGLTAKEAAKFGF